MPVNAPFFDNATPQSRMSARLRKGELPVLALLLPYDRIRAFAAGVLYMLLYAMGSQGVWAARHWLQRQSSPGAIRLRRWSGGAFVVRVSSLILALVFPFIMLITGIFAANDVGLLAVDWPAVLPWVTGITVGAAAWLALLWGVHTGRLIQRPHGETQYREGLADILLSALRHEASAATCRGALMPLAGPYWGIWLAILWKMLISRTNPFINARLKQAGQRELVLLDWALDWVGATLYAFSGSTWVALAGRAVCRATVRLVLHLISRRGQHATPNGLADDQGQDDQGHKAADGQNPETFQVA